MSQKNPTQLWMVPYADLMSILTMLFLGLFGFAYLDRKGGYEQAIAQMQQNLSKTPAEARSAEKELREAAVVNRLEQQAADEHLGIQVTAERIRMTFSSPVLFQEGSADLRLEASPSLLKVAQALKELPNRVVVEGYTDDRRVLGGRYKTNWELSAARAFSVIEFFVSQGLPPDRFSVLGYGEYHPVASNATEEGRMRNRRIEVSILRQESYAL